MVFLCMRSDKITKTLKLLLKRSFKAQVPRVYMFFGTRSLQLGSILKPDVELMVFLRTRSNRITKNCEGLKA